MLFQAFLLFFPTFEELQEHHKDCVYRRFEKGMALRVYSYPLQSFQVGVHIADLSHHFNNFFTY